MICPTYLSTGIRNIPHQLKDYSEILHQQPRQGIVTDITNLPNQYIRIDLRKRKKE